MFNFLEHKLLPKVVCNSPATDNYEATNLISDQYMLRTRGFLAYSVIKPPVELEFEFICPVNISYVVLKTTVGRQRCTGIEIFGKAADGPYISMGKEVYSEDGVIFCNSRLFSRIFPPPEFSSNELCLSFFKRDSYQCFNNATKLKIVIFRTEKSVPCLGMAKVVGKPARICSASTVETINKIMCKPSEPNSEKSDESFKVPDDFKDDLTCELMTIPMTLPSGKTVDRDTLDKHVENEATFGRKPGDPFTGLKFTDSRKPVLNAALKSRIDMFLLQNSDNSCVSDFKRKSSWVLGTSKRTKYDNDGPGRCCYCKSTDIDLYQIPCTHLYCKNCLLNLNVYKCRLCEKEFSSNDIERHHFRLF